MAAKRKVTDMMSRVVEIPPFPERIISIVPSQTELLYDLGLAERVIGITKFCIHPDKWFRSKTRIGGTKKLNFEQIKALKPDLIIGNKEENNQADITELEKLFPVWMSDIYTFQDALLAIQMIGNITQTSEKAAFIIQQIEKGFQVIPQTSAPKKCAYLIWHNPDMVAAHTTFIDAMLEKIGLENAFKHQDRYPVVDEKMLQSADIDVLLLSSEPYPFKAQHLEYYRSILPDAKILLVDGEAFSWYGSRLIHAPSYFKSLLKELA